MSTKKKASPKVQEPKAKYAVNQKVFIISYYKDKPEELKEGKVWAVRSRKVALLECGKTIGHKTEFSYDLTFWDGSAVNFDENKIYPNYPAAAQAFSKPFLTLLK